MSPFIIVAIAGGALCTQLAQAAPKKGDALAPRSDGVAVKNEPCYVHDSACEGYPVCCVTAGTCISQHSGTISSNKVYYEGGCQSKESSKKNWDGTNCTQQGECLVQHVHICKGGTTKSGYMSALSQDVMNRLMTGSCETQCPNAYYGHSSRNTGTTTTSTTVIKVVEGYMTFKTNGDYAWNDNNKAIAAWVIALAAGSGVSSAHITKVQPSSGNSDQTLLFEVTLSSAMSVNETDVKAAMSSVSSESMSLIMERAFGACEYTVSGGNAGFGKLPSSPGTSSGVGLSTSLFAWGLLLSQTVCL